MMELLQNSTSNPPTRDLKISKQPDERNITDCQDSLQIKIPEEQIKNSPTANEEIDVCGDKSVSKSSEHSNEEEKLTSVETSECSPSYSGATEPIDGNSPSYSGATEENLDTVSSPAKSNSPDPNCAICLGKLENKSFTDSCFHQFCFTCLLEWSKIKAECPLCKQAFKSIIHNVRSIEDYDQTYITVNNAADARRTGRSPEARRFRYQSTLTNERRRHLEFEHSIELQNHRLTYAPHLYRGSNSHHPSAVRSTNSDYRRNIYNNKFWFIPPIDNHRYRDTAPEFFRSNPACTHRLIPWLNRDLLALLSHSENQVSFIMELILALITRYDIRSSEFYEHVFPYLQDRTTHFVHEFFHFARSPYDMAGYDRNAIYEQLENPAGVISRDSSSSESVIEVPVLENYRRILVRRGRKLRMFGGYNPNTKQPRSSRRRNWERYSPPRGTNSQVQETLDIDMPGPSRQETSLPFRPWDTDLREFNNGIGSSTQESDEDCVIVDSVASIKKPPPLITIPSSSDEDIENSSIPPSHKKSLSYEKPATRKNRCTFHYDYSSDSCSEQTDTISSEGASNSESRKSKLKSIIGSVSTSLSIPSSSSEQSSHRSHKKHKKHKKHKHKHHRHKHSKQEKD